MRNKYLVSYNVIYRVPSVDDVLELREELSKKKIWKQKSYGLFFDYNQTFGDEEQ